MNTTTQIKPIQAGFPLQEATSIFVSVNVVLGATTSTSYWVLQNANNGQIATGNLEIPESIHSQWGTDDSFVLDYILETLNLEKL